jgi:hypothetical protein
MGSLRVVSEARRAMRLQEHGVFARFRYNDKSASVYLSLAGEGFPRYRLRPNSGGGELKFQAKGARQLMPGLKLLDRPLVRERHLPGKWNSY